MFILSGFLAGGLVRYSVSSHPFAESSIAILLPVVFVFVVVVFIVVVFVVVVIVVVWSKYTPHNRKTQIVHSPSLSPQACTAKKYAFYLKLKRGNLSTQNVLKILEKILHFLFTTMEIFGQIWNAIYCYLKTEKK